MKSLSESLKRGLPSRSHGGLRAHLEEWIELDRLLWRFGHRRRRLRHFYGRRCFRGCRGGSAIDRNAREGSTAIADHANDGADRGDFAFGNADFAQDAGFGRRHFHRDFVCFDLEQIVARLHRIAG
jgi:hypothetical protein